MIKPLKIVLYSALILLMASCKKEKGNDPLPIVSNTPNIVSVSINDYSINQFDDLQFTIAYTDGDGDLGEEDADVNSIFITDKRNINIVHEFHLQPLAPIGKVTTIQGNLKVHLNNVILLDQNNNTELVQFTIQLKDRAGNLSNLVTTPAVTITK